MSDIEKRVEEFLEKEVCINYEDGITTKELSRWLAELAKSEYQRGLRDGLEKAAKAVVPEDFELGSSEWCALSAALAAIRALAEEEQKERI